MNTQEHIIRFPQGRLDEIRAELLNDLGREAFCMLLARTRAIAGHKIVVVRDVRYPEGDDYSHRSIARVSVEKEFVHKIMVEAQSRPDVDTIIDVHTHPFADQARFSGQDDHDEIGFARFLSKKGLPFKYGSLVLSKKSARARLWTVRRGRPMETPAAIKTQTAVEALPTDADAELSHDLEDETRSRTALGLGLEAMRRIARGQRIVLAGVGGLGSVMAENLTHQGFDHLILIDDDRLDFSNLNRFVGGKYADALSKRLKVEVVADHLRAINPKMRVETVAASVDSPEAEEKMALADWIMLSTDTHTSRFQVQNTALLYGVPLISAGVNITAEKDELGRHVVTDRSGEVIVVRLGDGYCLNCLGRVRPERLAAESHHDPEVRAKTVSRGYVSGLDVKEPSAKTLNAVIGAVAVDSLTNQYIRGKLNEPLLVYESHLGAFMYPDRSVFSVLETGCHSCL